MPRKTITRMGLPLFVGLIIGGMLYVFSLTLEVAPLFGDVASHGIASTMASDVTNEGYPP
jgi:hypothetical protein